MDAGSHRETLKRELKNRFHSVIQFDDDNNVLAVTIPENVAPIDVVHHCEKRLNTLFSTDEIETLMKSTFKYSEKDYQNIKKKVIQVKDGLMLQNLVDLHGKHQKMMNLIVIVHVS